MHVTAQRQLDDLHLNLCVCMYVCMFVCVCMYVCMYKRHKCVDERRKPVSEQRGAAQCLICRKWFRSRGGLALHTYHGS